MAQTVQYLSEPGGLNGHTGTDGRIPRKNDPGRRRRPINAVDLCKTLRANGFTVLEAEGSSESLKILATHQEPIDLLLTDLLLPPPGLQFTSTENPYPRVHGHDVIQRTLAMKKAFRVILMSSLSEQERKAY